MAAVPKNRRRLRLVSSNIDGSPSKTSTLEQDWYSDSGSVKHQEGISTFSIDALMVVEKLDWTKGVVFHVALRHIGLCRVEHSFDLRYCH
jgi:hypothetical protein